MNRLPAVIVPAVIAIAGSVLGFSTSPAAGPGHSFAAKRQFATQVIDCMRKRMAADKYVSYNQAARTCKDQVTKQNGGADAGPLVAADTKH
jgi:hypothetical protein